jgi:aspartyl-tRNA(Asn)/glutamyl-tRNA(Gln) amidotransferase subunit C
MVRKLNLGLKMSISKQEVKKVAHLARLEITPQEEEEFTTQLSSILEYFQQLSELDTTDVPPTTRAIDIKNITRDDVNLVYPEREILLDAAPEREDDFFRVPQILVE